MTDLLTCILVLNVISGVNSLAIISRRVQNQSPNHRYKLSAPEVYAQQRVHRVATLPPHVQDRYHVLKVPKYRQKYKYLVKTLRPVVYPVLPSQKPRPPPPPPPLKKNHESLSSNDIDEPKDYESEADFPQTIVDQGERFPSFGKESPYQPIKKPGEWVAPTLSSDSAFTPVQMYLQIRQTNQVKHVPQSEALKDATTLEEVVNAPRLKELLRTTRVREVYSEEGYEDAGYDHGGHIRHAEHDEGYAAQDEGIIKVKEKLEEEDISMPEASRKIPKKRNGTAPKDIMPQESKLEPKISRSEVSSIEFATLPSKYKGVNKYSSKVRSKPQDEAIEISAGRLWVAPTAFAELSTTTAFDVYPFVPKDTTEGTTPRAKYIKIIASEDGGRAEDMNHGKDTQKTRKGIKYSRLHAKYPKRDRFRLAKLSQTTTTEESISGTETGDKRIILPTIGYINSLTTAHFGKNNTIYAGNNNVLTTALNLTQALNYLRSNKKDLLKSNTSQRKTNNESINLNFPFEPKKLRNRNRRELDEQEGEEHEEDNPDDGEKIHDEKNMEIEEEERRRLEGEEREEYEKHLEKELDREEQSIVRASLGKFGPKIRSEVLGEEVSTTPETTQEEVFYVTTVKPVDTSKYPFYFSERVHEDSPLRYATNPKSFPKKKGSGMVFYESREKLVQCPDVRPDLDDIPKKNTTLEDEGGNNSRLAGLGDKIACLRSKYFDEDPLDNPLFKEKEIDYVGRTKTDVRISRNSRYPAKELNAIPREKKAENLRYHSSYQYQPNRTIHIMVRGRPEPAKNIVPTDRSERIIPVTELVDETPSQERKIAGLAPPPLHRRYTRPTSSASSRSKIIIPHNCLHVIGKMAALDGHKNLIIHCNDAMLIQELQNDVRHLKIIPKITELPRKQYPRRKYASSFEASDWVPIPYPQRKSSYRFGRKRELVSNETRQVEKEATTTEPSVRRKRAVEGYDEEQKPTGKDLPLRLSLKEFFLLLQSTNHRNRWSPKPFQRPFHPPSKQEDSQEDEVVKLGGQYIKGTHGREYVYVRYGPTGIGRWIASDLGHEREERPNYAKKSFAKHYKKYGKGKL